MRLFFEIIVNGKGGTTRAVYDKKAPCYASIPLTTLIQHALTLTLTHTHTHSHTHSHTRFFNIADTCINFALKRRFTFSSFLNNLTWLDTQTHTHTHTHKHTHTHTFRECFILQTYANFLLTSIKI